MSDIRNWKQEGPAIIYSSGSKEWRKHGQLHRDDGPAIESASGDQYWYQHDRLHREDGPAIILHNGFQEWFLNGKIINVSSQEEFERYMKLKAFW